MAFPEDVDKAVPMPAVSQGGQNCQLPPVRDQIWQNKFLLSQIGNADQTPLNFDTPSNTTVEQRGTCTGHIPTTGVDKQRCMVMLAVTADGRKLPPYVIFKWETLPKGKFPPVCTRGCKKKVGCVLTSRRLN